MAIRLEDNRYIKIEESDEGRLRYTIYDSEETRVREKETSSKYNDFLDLVAQEDTALRAQIFEGITIDDPLLLKIEALSIFNRESKVYITAGIDSVYIPDEGIAGKSKIEIEEILANMRVSKSTYEIGVGVSLDSLSQAYQTFKDKKYIRMKMEDC